MRIALSLPVLLLAGALVAWMHDEPDAPLRIVILESLAGSTAEAAVPAFRTALSSRLAARHRVATFELIYLASTDRGRHVSGEFLRAADLVVSFGELAAETAMSALEGSTTPHLFAFVPRARALALSAHGASSGAETEMTSGISAHLPRGATFAIADRLLATRSGEPLRIGLVHEVTGDSAEATTSSLATVVPAPGFVPIPFVPEPGGDPGTLVSSVVAAAAAAIAGPEQIDAFWLALDASAPLDIMVRAIEVETSRPVIYAPSEAAVAAGALISLAPEPRRTGEGAAILALRLLDSAFSEELSLRAPHPVEFALNLETADALGIIPPYELIELARGRLFR